MLLVWRTAIIVTVLLLIVLQAIAFRIVGDVMTSLFIFGLGYFIGRQNN